MKSCLVVSFALFLYLFGGGLVAGVAYLQLHNLNPSGNLWAIPVAYGFFVLLPATFTVFIALMPEDKASKKDSDGSSKESS